MKSVETIEVVEEILGLMRSESTCYSSIHQWSEPVGVTCSALSTSTTRVTYYTSNICNTGNTSNTSNM
mgnify:CR=1 FL=1